MSQPLRASAVAAEPYRARHGAPPYHIPGALGEEGAARLWGNGLSPYPQGSARWEGVVIDGVYRTPVPVRVAERSIVGDPLASQRKLIFDPPEGDPWAYAAYGWPSQSSRLEGLTIAANGRAEVGLRLERCNGVTLRDVRVGGALGTGIELDRCISAPATIESLYAGGCGGVGIHARGINATHGTSWRVDGCEGGGIDLEGVPLVHHGDTSVHGIRVEACSGPFGVRVRNHLSAVELGGHFRVEAGRGRSVDHALVVQDAYCVITGAINLRSHQAVIVVDGGRLDIRGMAWLYCYTRAVPLIVLRNGGTLRGGGNIITAVEVVTE